MGNYVSEIAGAGEKILTRMDVIANNVANVSTPGFKAEHLYSSMKAASSVSGNSNAAGSNVIFQDTKLIDMNQGMLQKTGNSLDLAIDGDGFFTIQQQDGVSYTRNGSFALNKNNELVTKTGLNVLGESGPIRISGKNIEIDGEGRVISDGTNVGKLKITAFAKPTNLIRSNEGQFIDDGKAGITAAEKCRVVGGYLEASNVNAIKEMVEMMDIQRCFETYQKIIMTLSDFDKISTNRIGKIT